MKGNIDDRKKDKATGNGIASGLEWFLSGQTLIRVWPKADQFGPTCVKASDKSSYFFTNWPKFSRMLINLTPKAVQFSLKCGHFRVNWTKSERTLIDLQSEAVQSGIKSTHVGSNWSRSAQTLIKVIPKGVQVSTERKTSWRKQSASSRKATTVEVKADRFSQGSTAFQTGWKHSRHAYTASRREATQAGPEWVTLLQKQIQVDLKAKAAAAKAVKATQKIVDRPTPPGPPGTRPIDPNRGVLTFLFMP